MNAVTSASAATPKLCPSCGNRYPVDALFCPTDGTPLTTAPTASGTQTDPYMGREILGHIEIRQLAGVGAMGRVYRAFQRGIDRDVAVKILHRELSTNQQLVARFHREAKVASRLSHPNVVSVLLTGQLPDGAMYIVMEYLDGMSLQSAMAAAGGAFPLARALHIAIQLCDATGEAHAQGIVHRDIKPENVMLVRRAEDDDFVKVLDFGIARLNWGDQSMATAAGLIFGTARYISPEGAQGEAVGPPSDVYSIATLVYQMLSGRSPFEGDQAVALLVQQIHDAPPHLRAVPRAAYVPPAIADCVMKNLAKKPEERDPDARAFGRALLEAAKASGLSAEELVARPLLGPRGSGSMQIASMQRTRQMQLDAETAKKLAPQSSRPAKTDYEPPPRPVTEVPGGPIQGSRTTKWTPPVEVQAQLAVPTPMPPSHPSTIPPAPPSGVDATMDDDDLRVGTPPPRTLMSSGTITTPPPSTPAISDPRVSYPSKPPSGVESTLSDEAARRSRSRAVAIVLLCFLLGVAAAGVVAYKLGMVGPAAATVARDDLVLRADGALRDHRWDDVRALTDEGLSRWPNDRELLRIRELAADDLVKAARAKRASGEPGEALRLAKMARELDANDADAAQLASDCEADLAKMTPPSNATASASGQAASGVVAKSVSASVDVSTTRARAGQSIDFTARIATVPSSAARPSIDGPAFVVTGPGLGTGVRIAAVEDGGAFRANYTFAQPGRFTVTFSARANSSNVSAAKAVTIAGDAPSVMPPAPPPSAAPSADPPSLPTPTPSASAKWL
jgi:serine/threonine-protein kinase